jgi:hypothetical protein
LRITQAAPGTACAVCKTESPRCWGTKSKLMEGNPLLCNKCSKAEVRTRAALPALVFSQQ